MLIPRIKVLDIGSLLNTQKHFRILIVQIVQFTIFIYKRIQNIFHTFKERIKYIIMQQNWKYIIKQSYNKAQEKLNLSFKQIKDCDIPNILLFCQPILENIKTINLSKKIIYLGGNNIGPEGVKHLADGNFHNLTKLYLNDNKIGSEGIKYLAAAKFHRLRILHLQNNALCPEGVKYFETGVFFNLKELSIYSNQISLKNSGFSEKHFLIDPLPQIMQKAPDFSCPTSASFFIQNIPIGYHSKSDKRMIPYLIRESHQLSQDILKSCICALANKRVGSIIVVQKHQQNRIKSGFRNISEQNIKFMQYKLKRAKLAIFKNQFINIKIQGVPLLTKYDFLMGEIPIEQCIRIIVKVYPKSHSFQNFFHVSQVLIKNHKPVVHYNILGQTKPNKFTVSEAFDQQIYTQLFRTAEKKDFQEIRIVEKILLFKGVTVNRWSFFFQIEKYDLQVCQNLFSNCYKVFMEGNFEDYTPKLNPKFKSVVVALFKFGCDPVDQSRHIQSIFEDKKTEYDFIFPFSSYQKQILNFRKEQNSNDLSLYYVCFYPFQGKYKNFQKEWTLIEDCEQIKNKITVSELTNQVKFGIAMNEKQENLFHSLLYKKFKSAFNKPQLVKNQISFNPDDKNIGMYTFCFGLMSNLSPKYVK